MAIFTYKDIRLLPEKSMTSSNIFVDCVKCVVSSYVGEHPSTDDFTDMLDSLPELLERKYYCGELLNNKFKIPEGAAYSFNVDSTLLFRQEDIGILKISTKDLPKILWIVYKVIPREGMSEYVEVRFVTLCISEVIDKEFVFHSVDNLMKSIKVDFLVASFKGEDFLACYLEEREAELLIPVQ